MPIQCRFISIKRQSDVNQLPIQRQSVAKPIRCQSDVNQAPIQRQSDVNPVSILPINSQFNVNPHWPTSSQSCANIMPIQCQPDADLVPSRCRCIPIRCQSSADTSQSTVNPMPIRRKSGAHQVSTYLNLMSIWRRSSANLMPIQCQSGVN